MDEYDMVEILVAILKYDRIGGHRQESGSRTLLGEPGARRTSAYWQVVVRTHRLDRISLGGRTCGLLGLRSAERSRGQPVP